MAREQTASEQALAELIVSALRLEVSAEVIDPDAALFGNDVLGLDSIDALELAFAISKKYGVTIKSDSDDNMKIFSSLASLSEYISANEGKS